jgi:hypothetical protein
MSEPDRRVPEHLRDELRGLRSDGTNDVAWQPEDDNPEQYVGELIEEDA